MSSTHNTPIYFSNILIQKFKINKNKSTTNTSKQLFEGVVIKGFHINQMKKTMKKRIQKKFSIKDEFEIIDIELLTQLGSGVSE